MNRKTTRRIAAAGAAALVLSVSGTAFAAVAGDVNGDGTLSAADAVILTKYLTAEPADIDGAAADLSGDGRINAVDLALLKRLLLSDGGQSDDPQPSSRYVTQITYAENAVTLKNADGAVISPDQAENVTVENGTVVTVTKPTDAGEISADGECSQGQLRIDVDKTAYPDAQVAVSLRGLTLANSSDSPIYAASVGDELVLTVKKDTVNTISDGTSYQNADGSAGAVYACDDLKIKGKGTLIVNGNCEDGIVSKDDLKLWNGNLQVNAADDGIRGKDSVRIGDPDAAEGYDSLSVTVKTTGGDGIKSTGTDEGKGFVRINGGTVTIDSYLDGISGEQSVEINGGTIDIHTFEGASYSGGSQGGYGGFGGGDGNKNKTDVSAKGIKAVGLYDTDGTTWKSGGNLYINGGTITIDSSDDCLHGGGDLFLYGGCMMLQTADDGVHSDHSLTVGETAGTVYDNVQIIVTKGYEGLEAQHIIQNSGTVIAHVTDDGFNAGGGNDGSGNQGGFNPWGGGGGRGGFSSGGDYSLTFNGGFALVDVENSGDHDGIDSNGSITVTGGILITNGNQPFDYGAESGGKLDFSNNAVWIENSRTSHYMETQPNYTVTGGSTAQGQRISLIGSDGKVIVSFIAGKQVTVLRAGGNVSGAKFCTGGTLSADTTYFQTAYSDQLAAYGGTLSGGTASSGSGRT